MAYLRLNMTDPSQETPDVRVWLDDVAEKIEQEIRRQQFNLLAYGTTKPHGEET